MIEMRVRQQNRVDLAGINGEARPIAQTQLLKALEQAAIDQQSMFGTFEEIFGARDSPGPAQK